MGVYRPAKATKQVKVDWLLAHQKMWEGWPRGAHGLDARKAEIVNAMKKEGLISLFTYLGDVRLDSLIDEARRQRIRGHVKKS